MAGRGRASFQKRQKEQLRLERRQQKVVRKEERKLNKEEEPELVPGPQPIVDEELGPIPE